MSQELVGNERSVKVLDATFFDRPAEKVAYDLIGCHLHCRNGDQSASRIITETEAYIGRDDLASHAAKGRTVFCLNNSAPSAYSNLSSWQRLPLQSIQMEFHPRLKVRLQSI